MNTFDARRTMESFIDYMTDELNDAMDDKLDYYDGDIDRAFDSVYDLLHEHVDGIDWCIYHSKAWAMAAEYRDDNEAMNYFEEMFTIERGSSLNELMTNFCYSLAYTRAQDLLNYIKGQREDLRDNDEKYYPSQEIDEEDQDDLP